MFLLVVNKNLDVYIYCSSDYICEILSCVHKVVVNHLGGLSLPRKSVVRLIK